MTRNTIVFDWEGLSLAGTLHLPDTRGPQAVVVMLQGSGPTDRTNNGYFPVIQEAFWTGGIGTFAFDKPGCGESTGDWREHALRERADQALAAVRTVRSRPEVNAEAVGVYGHSQGGWIVQMMASRLDDLPFAAASSGPSISLPEQDLYGCEHSMRADGYSEAEIESALRFVTNVHDAARNGLSYGEAEVQFLDSARSQSWYGGYMTIDDEKDWGLMQRFVNEGYEPMEALREIRCPFLAVYRGRDILVPSWLSAQQLGEAFVEAGNPDATVVVFPYANHQLQHEPAEFVSGYLDLLVHWTARHVA